MTASVVSDGDRLSRLTAALSRREHRLTGNNIAFAFIGSGIIWVCSRVWLGAAKVLFWSAAALMALSVAHFLFVAAAGAIAWALKRGAPLGGDQPSWKWLWGATAARLVEQVLCLTALWLAARAVGYLR